MREDIKRLLDEFETKNKRKPKLAAYVRVSTSEAQQLVSYDNQRTYFEREFDIAGYEIAIYADKGQSGTKINRPAFARMLKDAGLEIKDDYDEKTGKKIGEHYALSSRKPKIDFIFIKNTSRFARNMELVSVINRLAEKEVYIYFMDIGKCTSDSESIMLIQLLLTFDENESRDKSRKVLFGREESAKKGTIFATSKMYGYDYDKEHNRLIKNEKEAKVIKRMFELYSTGLGCRRVAKQLNEEGYRKNNGGEWIASDVVKKIPNEKYMGYNNPQRHYKRHVFQAGPNYEKRKKKGEYILQKMPDRIPPIVSEELFAKCQEVWESHTKYARDKGGIAYSGISKYGSKLRCTKCGAFLHCHTYKGGKKVYECATKKLYGKERCNSKNLSMEYVDNIIKEMQKGNYINEQLSALKKYTYANIYRYIESILMDIDDNILETVAPVEKRLDEVSKMLDNIQEKILQAPSDTISKSFQEKMENLILERKMLLEQKEDILSNNTRIYDKVNEIIAQYEDGVKNMPKKKKYSTQEIINMIRCIDFDDKEVKWIYWNVFGDEIADLEEEMQDWYGGEQPVYFDIPDQDADNINEQIKHLEDLVKASK